MTSALVKKIVFSPGDSAQLRGLAWGRAIIAWVLDLDLPQTGFATLKTIHYHGTIITSNP